MSGHSMLAAEAYADGRQLWARISLYAYQEPRLDRLPFATGSAGAALAMHMLYYASDQRAALEELRRVLRPGGRLAVSTNGLDAGAELRDLWTGALRDLGIAPPPCPRTDEPFLLDRARNLVRDVFGAAGMAEHHSRIVVPRPEPVLDHAGAFTITGHVGVVTATRAS